MPQNIEKFVSDLIAILRPKKKTYSLLEFKNDTRRWRRFLLDPDITPTITLWKQNIPVAPVKIKIDATDEFVSCKGTGSYLKYGDKLVPVIIRDTHSVKKFSQGFYDGEITVGAEQQEILETPRLWTLFPIVQTPPPTPLNIIINKGQQIKMPQRIAWVIAEDASKNNEECAITLTAISPITASVTSCFHIFDTEAIKRALKINAMCPMCRTKNVTYTKCYTE